MMSHSEVTLLLVSIAVLLGFARLLGEIAHSLGQPAVLGEILAGILLGPTVLGALFPDLHQALFSRSDRVSLVIEGITTFAVVLFLLVAGLEVDLSKIISQGTKSLKIALGGLLIPMTAGVSLGFWDPEFFGSGSNTSPWVFAIFLGMTLSICALPVIARILLDLNLYRSDFGMTVISVAILFDLMGWMIFAMILGVSSQGTLDLQAQVTGTLGRTLGFLALVFLLLRPAVHRVLPWIQAYATWPGGVLGFVVVLGLLGAALAETIGVHAIFGAFMVGIAVGDSAHLRQHTRTTLEQFIGFIFAPLFFASIGLKVDFQAHFDPMLTLCVLVVACAGQVTGSSSMARLCGFPAREALSIGFALNARGAMEIILGMLALQAGIITERLFVALVVMALVTSMVSGPAIRFLLQLRRGKGFLASLSQGGFIPGFSARNRYEAILKLSAVAQTICNRPADLIYRAVVRREESMGTALDNGVAVPHAELDGLDKTVMLVALCPSGIDFDASDGHPANVIVLLLTPRDRIHTQLEIVNDISLTFTSPATSEVAAQASNLTEFLAHINVQKSKKQKTIHD